MLARDGLARMSNVALAVAFAVSAAACATAKFQRDKPVEIGPRRPGGRIYTQEGKQISLNEMLTEFESVEETREAARAAQQWWWARTSLATCAAVVTLYGVHMLGPLDPESSTKSRNEALGWTLAGTGLALFGGAFLAEARGDSYARRAIEAHNSRLPRAATIAPWLAPLSGAAGAERIAAGVTVEF